MAGDVSVADFKVYEDLPVVGSAAQGGFLRGVTPRSVLLENSTCQKRLRTVGGWARKRLGRGGGKGCMGHD